MWEYLETKDPVSRVIDMGLAKYPPKDDEAACNLLGREGWELVNCSGSNGRWWYFFKRPLIEKDEE